MAWPGFGDSVREPQWVWAATGGIALALASDPRRWPGPPEALIVWILYLLILGVAGPDPYYALTTLAFPAAVGAGAWGVMAARRFPSESALTRVLLAVTLLQLSLGVLQVLDADPFFTHREVTGLEPGLPGGFAGHHTMYGLVLALFSYWWLVKRKWVLAALCALAVLSTKSAFALASLFFGGLWFAWCRGWKKSAAAAGTAAVTIGAWLFLSSDRPGDFFFHNGRLPVWIYALKAMGEKPWLGYGVGGFSRVFPRYYQVLEDKRWREAHNELLEYTFNTGIIGLLAMLPVAVLIAARLRKLAPGQGKEIAVGTLLMLAVNSVGSFPLQIAPFATLAIYSLAWVVASPRGDTAREPG